MATLLGAEKVVAVDIFRERVSLRSEEHGPRTMPLVVLRDEMAEAAAGGETPTAQPGSGERQSRKGKRR